MYWSVRKQRNTTQPNPPGRRLVLIGGREDTMKLLLILCVPLIVEAGKWKPINSMEDKVVCKSYCMTKYFDCYREHNCAKPTMKYKIQLCQKEYIACSKKCLYELELLDEKVALWKLSAEDRALFKKLRKELSRPIGRDVRRNK
ncbi:hypothetical protein LSAT2_021900 [Lamellibrachia satsuma]|nr:hypothetical protein LSAT2_021900 [Lamellibrachia satsuma]